MFNKKYLILNIARSTLFIITFIEAACLQMHFSVRFPDLFLFHHIFYIIFPLSFCIKTLAYQFSRPKITFFYNGPWKSTTV